MGHAMFLLFAATLAAVVESRMKENRVYFCPLWSTMCQACYTDHDTCPMERLKLKELFLREDKCNKLCVVAHHGEVISWFKDEERDCASCNNDKDKDAATVDEVLAFPHRPDPPDTPDRIGVYFCPIWSLNCQMCFTANSSCPPDDRLKLLQYFITEDFCNEMCDKAHRQSNPISVTDSLPKLSPGSTSVEENTTDDASGREKRAILQRERFYFDGVDCARCNVEIDCPIGEKLHNTETECRNQN